MIEKTGDLLAFDAEWIVIPTNGQRRMNGSAVMGAGLARVIADLNPDLPAHFGKLLKYHGNHVLNLGLWKVREDREANLVGFPTKHDWRASSDLELIRRSARELRADFDKVGMVALPRVGCGCGQLAWSVVAPVLREELPEDSFVVVTPP